jgi:hypothetical protein
MAIEFRCTQCGKLLRTGDETAGRQAKCPECGTVMPIPAASGSLLGGSPPPPPSGGTPFGAAGPPASGPTDFGSPFQSLGPPPPTSPFQPQGAIKPTMLAIGDVFSHTWTIFKPNWGICLAVVVIVWLISSGVGTISIFIPILGLLIAMLFQTWINIGQALFFLKKARGHDAEIGEIFTGWPYFWKILGSTILVGLIMIGILAVCVLPPLLVGLAISETATVILAVAGGVVGVALVIFLSLMLSQFYYLILDRNVGVMESLKMSKELMEGNKLTMLGIGVLSFLLMCVAMIPCFLGLLVAIPFFALMYPVIYLTVTGQPTADQMHVGPTT